MRNIPLNSWDDFRDEITRIQREFGSTELVQGIRRKNKILYRGQSNSRWPLESTLERYSTSRWSVESYTSLLRRLVPTLESFTEQRWRFPKSAKWDEGERLPCNEMWVYLRHCNFPSPLLDWTLSPYIAAFFAFEEDVKEPETASIFVYIEAPEGRKSWWEGSPHISVPGIHEKTHKRHFLQQSFYTICTTVRNGEHEFANHADVFASKESNRKMQDVLLKISIPRLKRERVKVLSDLDRMNINHFSLFQSEVE